VSDDKVCKRDLSWFVEIVLILETTHGEAARWSGRRGPAARGTGEMKKKPFGPSLRGSTP
jgi:hypothetical protein